MQLPVSLIFCVIERNKTLSRYFANKDLDDVTAYVRNVHGELAVSLGAKGFIYKYLFIQYKRLINFFNVEEYVWFTVAIELLKI